MAKKRKVRKSIRRWVVVSYSTLASVGIVVLLIFWGMSFHSLLRSWIMGKELYVFGAITLIIFALIGLHMISLKKILKRMTNY